MTTEQVARRLGVKPETVYAYVSRGMLHSTRSPDGRGSCFDAAEVEALATRAGSRRAALSAPQISTALTMIREGRLHYRGRDAADLATAETFESVATLLWTGRLDPAARFEAPGRATAMARKAIPSGVGLLDRLRLTIGVVSTTDPMRFDTRPEAVARTGRLLLASLTDALSPTRAAAGSLAHRLWANLSPLPPDPPVVRSLNAALVLLADHDLAASTLAARVVASTRAHPYAVVAAGISAFEGPLHGAGSSRAYRLIEDSVATGEPERVFFERLRTDGHVEGFTVERSLVYPQGDTRAATLLGLLTDLPTEARLGKALTGLLEVGRQSGAPPSVELAIAALVHIGQMAPDAGEAIFVIARTVGWLAHAIEEYEAPERRFGARGTYTGFTRKA